MSTRRITVQTEAQASLRFYPISIAVENVAGLHVHKLTGDEAVQLLRDLAHECVARGLVPGVAFYDGGAK